MRVLDFAKLIFKLDMPQNREKSFNKLGSVMIGLVRNSSTSSANAANLY